MLTFASKQARFCTKRVNHITLVLLSGATKDGFAFLSLQKKGPEAEQPQNQGYVGGTGGGGAGGDMKDLL